MFRGCLCYLITKNVALNVDAKVDIMCDIFIFILIMENKIVNISSQISFN